jgi:hypothetical protein
MYPRELEVANDRVLAFPEELNWERELGRPVKPCEARLRRRVCGQISRISDPRPTERPWLIQAGVNIHVEIAAFIG